MRPNLPASGVDDPTSLTPVESLRERRPNLDLFWESPDAIDHGLWIVDREARTISGSPKVLTILGYQPGEIELLSYGDWMGRIHPDDLPAVVEAARDHVSGRTERFSVEVRLRTRMGGWCWLLARGKVVQRDGEGIATRMIGTLTEITERKRLEEALRASEARLRAAIDSLPFDFWMIGEDGRYVMQNAYLQQLYGDVVGKRPQDLDVPAETLALWQENNRRAFAGEVIRDDVEFMVGEERRCLHNVISPIHDGERIIGILGINLDITERCRAQKALERRNDELSRANRELERLGRAKDQLTAMISHELRSPLVTGLGYIEMLLEGALGPITPRIRSRMETAKRNLQRLSELIEGILRYQRLINAEAGALAGGACFDVVRLVEQAIGALEEAEGFPRERVESRVETEQRTIRGDAGLIRTVLVNLLTNAARHAGAGASIRVRVRQAPPGSVRFAVEDDGAGVPAELQAAAFEPFVRSMESKEGYGLGLAIVSAILKVHGTRPVLHSEEGRGTTVSFSLPALVNSP